MTPTTVLTAADRMQTLRACPVFADVPGRDLGVLAEMMQTERLQGGELLFEHGEASDRVYVVAGGRLAILLPGRSEPVRFLGRGDLLGEYGMFLGLSRTASARAETEMVLLSLDYRRFLAFLTQFPESTLVLLRTVVQRLVALERETGKASTP
jgi:CRP-like cAMP-binding protein